MPDGLVMILEVYDSVDMYCNKYFGTVLPVIGQPMGTNTKDYIVLPSLAI